MGMNKYNKNKVISSKYAKGIDFNDYVEGFIDEEGPDVRNNDDRRTYGYTMKMFPGPDW